jgi:hypothetical protein
LHCCTEPDLRVRALINAQGVPNEKYRYFSVASASLAAKIAK